MHNKNQGAVMATDYPFRNLVFEGGGVKGIAYLGALEVLEERGILPGITRVAGTSVGAVNALLLSLGYSLAQTRRVLWSLDFANFLDDDWGVVRDSRRFMRHFGWYRGEYFERWAGELIRRKTGDARSSFAQLRQDGFRDLTLVVTNLSTGYSELCSAERTPDMPVVEALRMSVSIPFFFTAVRRDPSGLYVDGGLLRNYPVRVFDREQYLPAPCRERHGFVPDYYQRANAARESGAGAQVFNKETLGFRLDTREQIDVFRDGKAPSPRPVNDLFDFVKAVVGTVMDVQDTVHLQSEDWQRTIYIDSLGIGTLDFDIRPADKRRLIAEGRKGVEHYLDWYGRARGRNLPCNHPGYRRRPSQDGASPELAKPVRRKDTRPSGSRSGPAPEKGL